MTLSQAEIVEHLHRLLPAEQIDTDPDTLRLRSIDNFRKLQYIFDRFVGPFPAAVVYPNSTEEVATLLAFADEQGVNVVARTGGTATEGGLETPVEHSIVVDGGRMNRILSIDAYNMQATVQCGVPLQVLEDEARKVGLTTGHSPQSKPVAHLGGLTATRSIGQFSTLYGGIEDMIVGCEVVFPGGEVCRIKNVPRRAAGPDIRHIVIGNEGALCYITEVTVKLFPYHPENHTFLGWTVKTMKEGFEVLREVMVAGFKPSVARLYDYEDGQLHFSHFVAPDDCIVLFMAEGNAGIVKATADGIAEIAARHPGCVPVDPAHLAEWFYDLTWGPDKITREDERIRTTRNVNRTTEISADWSTINDIYDAVLPRIRAEIRGITLLGGHSSHSYINGTNMYFNYFYDIDCEPEQENEEYYFPIIDIICEETLKRGGSIVHHHGIGKARSKWVREEYGTSFHMLETLKHAFDPNGVMNMGTIIPRS
ncbi:MAG TPA: FAD-binding oxidoreductase [Acidimicrobiaceae bacterium]|nr:FAD-binding oxidoreductase [Acidimicrobiaceae bacterium]